MHKQVNKNSDSHCYVIYKDFWYQESVTHTMILSFISQDSLSHMVISFH